MELFQFGPDPWGQEILIRLSWGLLTVSFWAGIAFVLFHAVYAVVWKPKVAGGGDVAGDQVATASRHLDLVQCIRGE